ncbi:MAG: amino acid permease [Candidatus Bathyarchaeia archaeon]|nr:amino acid permease [Candidatus Bathyarchaeota archaeon]
MGELHLKRELGLLRATMLGIGGTLSAGNFVIIGHAAGLAGYGIVPVVFICGIISLLTMFSYCELGTAIPKAGGEYTFAKAAYGGFISFITGWFEWVSNMFYAALSSIGFAYVISYIFPKINIPLTAALVVIIFTIINIRGVKETGTVETLITALVLAILGIYILRGWPHTQQAQAPILSPPTNWLGIFAAIAYLFELYLGAEAVAAAQAEIKNPEKNIPRAIILSSIVLIALYTSIVYVAVSVVPPEVLSKQPSPIAFVAEQVMGPIGGILVTIGLAIAGLAATNEAIMAQSRVLYAMGRDGYFPQKVSKIHKRFGTPYIAVTISAVFTLFFTATGLVNFVVYAVNLGFIVGFSIVNLSVIKLRKEKPYLERPFKAPFYPLTPIAGLAASIFLVAFIEPAVLILGLELSIIALFVYYIRMVGYHRLRIAFGGMSLGTGVFASFTAYLIRTSQITLNSVSAEAIFYILIFVSAVQILAGVFNITTSE